MEHESSLSFSHTADYLFIDAALKARWAPVMQLAQELDAFVPKKISDFSHYRDSELLRLRKLNPDSDDQSLLDLIDGQIRGLSEPAIQVDIQFSSRVMAEYVTVAFLAHALAEAAINAILAIGLSAAGAAEAFALLERAEIKEKWLAGPKAFHPAYTLSKSSALFQTLQHLTRERNAFVHYKVELEMRGEKRLEGSRINRVPLGAQIAWMKRFFSLPYDLAAHALSQLRHLPLLMLWDSSPIERFSGHSGT